MTVELETMEAEVSAPEPPDEMAARLYEELRAMARRELAGERAGHTLQPTALIHEAYLRLLGEQATFENRAHFFGSAARAIRRVLVDHARSRASQRRGGEFARVEGVEGVEPANPQSEHWLALDAALERLAERSPLQARVVELRFFADMSNAEMACALEVSESTVARAWRVARAWLRSELEADGA